MLIKQADIEKALVEVHRNCATNTYQVLREFFDVLNHVDWQINTDNSQANNHRHKALPVPYLCQWGPNANRSPGDCGPACVAMAVHYLTDQRPTVDEVATACGQPEKSNYTNLTQVSKGARAYGLKTTYTHPLTRPIIQHQLNQERPIIALVNYGRLPDNQDDYTGAHFLLLVGCGNEHVIVHDPDRLSGESFGEFRHIPWADFLDALGSTAQTPGNSRNNHGIVLYTDS